MKHIAKIEKQNKELEDKLSKRDRMLIDRKDEFKRVKSSVLRLERELKQAQSDLEKSEKKLENELKQAQSELEKSEKQSERELKKAKTDLEKSEKKSERELKTAGHNYNDHRGVSFPARHADPQQYPVAPGHEMMSEEKSRPSSASRKQLFLGWASLLESCDPEAHDAAMAMANMDSYL